MQGILRKVVPTGKFSRDREVSQYLVVNITKELSRTKVKGGRPSVQRYRKNRIHFELPERPQPQKRQRMWAACREVAKDAREVWTIFPSVKNGGIFTKNQDCPIKIRQRTSKLGGRYWKRLLWSDECKINCIGSSGWYSKAGASREYEILERL